MLTFKEDMRLFDLGEISRRIMGHLALLFTEQGDAAGSSPSAGFANSMSGWVASPEFLDLS